MCHLALFMPVFALPVFWLLPWPMATAIYVVVLVLSTWLYYVVIKIMHRPSRIGLQTLIDARGRVVQANGSCGLARIGRELWKIEANEPLKANEEVKVKGRHGFVLDVAHTDSTVQKTRASTSIVHRWARPFQLSGIVLTSQWSSSEVGSMM